jgi:drug/metabolite transporter (DMT)-like permease
MLGANLAFAAMAGMIRLATETMHPFEVAFFRNLFGLVFMLPWLARVGFGALRTQRLPLHFLRGAVALSAMLTFFYGLSKLPLSDVTAIGYTTPLFATLLAPLFLGEQIGWHRRIALAVGFTGALIVIRPGLSAFDPVALIVLGSAFLIGITTSIIKTLSRTEAPDAIVTYLVLIVTPAALVPAALFWTWPSPLAWAIVIAIGGFGTMAQKLMARGFATADASYVVLFEFTRLPFAAAIGWFAFSQTTDIWTWVGAGVIAAAGFYVVRRETLRTRAAPASSVPPAGHQPPL